MKVFASIITYNPNISVLQSCIFSVIHQVDRLLVIDNGSLNSDEIKCLIEKSNNMNTGRIVCRWNHKNQGIAYALNQAVHYCNRNGAEWLLTLDQDSIIPNDLIRQYKPFCDNKTGQICCNLVNPKLKKLPIHKMSPLTLPVNRFRKLNYYKIFACVTSGSLLNVEACKNVGLFDDSLFIDYVDYDMSLKLYYAGYNNIFLPNVEMIHNFGEAEEKSLLGIKYTDYCFSPFRIYYKARNCIIMIKRYPYFKRTFYKAFLYELYCTLRSLDTKKIKSFYNGIIDAKMFF